MNRSIVIGQIAVVLIVATAVVAFTLRAQPPAAPVGVQVVMSDGTIQSYPLGVWLMFQSGRLRAVMPTQYVGQVATRQADGSWKYPRPGRNVQVWRRGLLLAPGIDYTLDLMGARVIPILPAAVDLITGAAASLDWDASDVVQVAYLY